MELGKCQSVDKSNHKITGAFIVKAFVRSVLTNRPISLRSIEVLTKSSSDLNSLLKTSDKDKAKLDHSSLGKRLDKISVNYFAAIYEDLVAKSSTILASSLNSKIHRFDYTILTLCGRIIQDGINVGGPSSDTQIKMSVGLKGSIPASIRFCTNQSDASEDVALTKAINQAKLDKEDIVLFDRGIAKGETFNDFSKRDIKFVTRINGNRRYEVIKKNHIPEEEIGPNSNSKLKIISDEIINLYYRKNTIKNDLRLIRVINDSGTEILFLTNLNDPSAIEIANTYKLRWDIEVFFKFLKQHLQFKHFIAHSLNGMMAYIYSILIAAILFTIFKHQNNLTGFKIALLQFTLELEKEIIKDLIILCGGDPNKSQGVL